MIHAANPPDTFFIVGLFYRIFGKKFVFDQHDLAPEMFQVIFKKRSNLIYKLMRFLEWCSYKTAHLVIVTNESQKRFAIERGRCHADRVFVVRNGPNLQQWKPGAPEFELKRRYPSLLGYVGLMGIQDGVDYALYALHDLVHKRGRQDVSLVLMGDGGYAPTLHRLAHELKLDEYVNFTEWISKEDVIRYLTVADICLIPDPQNGLNEFSTMIKAKSCRRLANKIEELLANEELRLRMGAIGRRRVEEILCWSHTKQNLLLAYATLFPHITNHPLQHTLNKIKGNYSGRRLQRLLK